MYRISAIILFVFTFCGLPHAADENGALPLAVHPVGPGVNADDLLDPDHTAWQQSPVHPIQLHRTPPLYADGPYDDGERPEASVRLVVHESGQIFIQLVWIDATDDSLPQAQRHPDGGEDHIYKLHSAETDRFGDAASVMVPQSRKPMAAYPSMMMGDPASPVDLFFWQAGRGFTMMQAHGRASTQANTNEVAGKSFRTETGWKVVFSVRDLSNLTPICFAIWDGAKQHRDGLKYYSLWYEIQL